MIMLIRGPRVVFSDKGQLNCCNKSSWHPPQSQLKEGFDLAAMDQNTTKKGKSIELELALSSAFSTTIWQNGLFFRHIFWLLAVGPLLLLLHTWMQQSIVTAIRASSSAFLWSVVVLWRGGSWLIISCTSWLLCSHKFVCLFGPKLTMILDRGCVTAQ